MRTVIQRVSEASVRVDGKIIGEIGPGLLLLLGVERGDTENDAVWLSRKVARLRIFEDPDSGQMARSLVDIGGGGLVISQFTLHASTKKGTRPSFTHAAPPLEAEALYERFLEIFRADLGRPIEAGTFGADMEVTLVNDGPVTILIDSRRRE